jgi:hypothetical protein
MARIVGALALAAAVAEAQQHAGDMNKCLHTLAGTTINAACCHGKGVACVHGKPTVCTVQCAKEFAPFYSECSKYLTDIPNLDLDSIMDMCQAAGGSSGVSKEMTTVGGFINGGFEDEPINVCQYTCGQHEWGPLQGKKCGHKYKAPVAWSVPKGGTAIICNKSPFLYKGHKVWGDVTSHSGKNFLALQGSGNFIEQTVSGLTPGHTYEISFLATHRPGMGDDEALKVSRELLNVSL